METFYINLADAVDLVGRRKYGNTWDAEEIRQALMRQRNRYRRHEWDDDDAKTGPAVPATEDSDRAFFDMHGDVAAELLGWLKDGRLTACYAGGHDDNDAGVRRPVERAIPVSAWSDLTDVGRQGAISIDWLTGAVGFPLTARNGVEGRQYGGDLERHYQDHHVAMVIRADVVKAAAGIPKTRRATRNQTRERDDRIVARARQMLQDAAQRGLRVSDKQVAKAIEDSGEFFKIAPADERLGYSTILKLVAHARADFKNP